MILKVPSAAGFYDPPENGFIFAIYAYGSDTPVNIFLSSSPIQHLRPHHHPLPGLEMEAVGLAV